MTPEELEKLLKEVIGPMMDGADEMREVIKQLAADAAKYKMDAVQSRVYVAEKALEAQETMLRNREHYRGEQGESGSDGKDGSRGDRGERGYKGETGSGGRDGRTGHDGARGDRGERGYNGKKGSAGQMGDRGETGDRGDVGKQGPQGETGIFGRDGKDGGVGPRGDIGKKGIQGEVGKRGPIGQLPAVVGWQKRIHDAGEVVTHGGATWQARRKTGAEPDADSNAWELLTNGYSHIEWTKDNQLSIRMADGEEFISPALRGIQGEPGEMPKFCGNYKATTIYRSVLDIVKHNGSTWLSIKSGVLQPPGSNKGKGSWICMAHRGPEGPKGKDADEAAIEERVIKRLQDDQMGVIERTIALVNAYFDQLDGLTE